MGDDYRYDGDCGVCDSFDPCCDKDEGSDLGSWIPILIIVFLLSGGFDWFGGGRGKDSCSYDKHDSCGGSGWILILVVVLLIFTSGDDKKGGGFLGGLFG